MARGNAGDDASFFKITALFDPGCEHHLGKRKDFSN